MGFIQQIPQAIFQSLGFMAVLFLIFEFIQYLFKLSSNTKYWIACLFYGIALLHFLFEVITINVAVLPKFSIPIEIPNQIQWLTIIGISYLIMVIGYFIFFLYKWFQLQHIQSNASYKIESSLDEWFKAHVVHLNLKQKVKIGYSKQVDGPVTFGWMEPIILMPFSLLNQISTEEMKFILLHELAHILRNDFIVHLFVEIAQVILCFNPFSYYFSKVIRIEREKICDEWVISQTKDPLLYTKALYQLAKYNYKNNHLLSLGAVENGSELLLRIKLINGLNTTKSNSKTIMFKVVLGLGLSLLLLLKNDFGTTKIRSIQNLIASNKNLLDQKKGRTVLSQNNKISNQKIANYKKSIATSDMVMNPSKVVKEDSSYQQLVNATMAWINARELKENNETVFANYEDNKTLNDYSVAEKLLLKAVLHKYELKRTILANAISKANSQEDALIRIQQSKEWLELKQYEKWASQFLMQHPNLIDSSKLADF